MIWHLSDLFAMASRTKVLSRFGVWVPARPLSSMSCCGRLKAAWLVFIGRADAVIWPDGQ